MKILKTHFQIHYFGPFWSVKYFDFFSQSYWVGLLIILFLKVDTPRLLKICIIFCLPAEVKYTFFSLQLMNYIGGWRKFHTKLVYFFDYFFGDKKIFSEPFWPAVSSAYSWILLICVARAWRKNWGKYTDLGCYVVDVFRSAEGRVSLLSCERLGRGLLETIAS